MAGGERVGLFGVLLGSCPGAALGGCSSERSLQRRFPARGSTNALRSARAVSDRRMRSTAQGAERGESRGGYWKGETSESLNPMDGFGMK